MFGSGPASSDRARPAQDACAVVAIGMSAGALDPLKQMIRALPAGFPGAMVIAHHVTAPSVLPSLVEAWGAHRAVFAARGMALQHGTIYVGPPEHHVVVNPDGTLDVSVHPRVRFVRPSIDWLFESVAASFGDRAVAVVLSGANDDGARGVRRVRRCGGRVLVQDPHTAAFPAMPLAAQPSAHALVHPCELAWQIERELARIEREGEPLGWAM